ncbi:MAG: hypothetical protein D6698_07200 [Gammaproteobacteria bacterium]|nr:MAG: hypothetical protein D6698_07200 [Gammaproteobacteria bacterium]
MVFLKTRFHDLGRHNNCLKPHDIPTNHLLDNQCLRFPVSLIMAQRVGLGEHQVTREEKRIENSFGISIVADLFLMRACHQEISPGKSWSIQWITPLVKVFRSTTIMISCEINRNGVYHFFGWFIRACAGDLP